MGRRNRAPLPATVEMVRRRIAQWRGTRASRGAMPEDLWEAAVSAAQEHGVYLVARGLSVNCATLKLRMVEAEARERVEPPAESCGFVEVTPAQFVAPPAARGTEVELTAADGGKLTIRGLPEEAVDVPALVAAFCGHRA